MTKPTYKDIAEMVGKQETTIKSWRGRNEELLELIKLGATCKANHVDEVELEMLIKFKEELSQKLLSINKEKPEEL